MFYSQLLLAKKGALGKVWLAAHYDRRLTKAQIANTDIKTLVASVEKPSAALSLRVSAHLLLGLSKIFQRQVMYLFVETNDALVKIRAVRAAQGSAEGAGRAEDAGGAGVRVRAARGCSVIAPCSGDLHVDAAARPAGAARVMQPAARPWCLSERATALSAGAAAASSSAVSSALPSVALRCRPPCRPSSPAPPPLRAAATSTPPRRACAATWTCSWRSTAVSEQARARCCWRAGGRRCRTWRGAPSPTSWASGRGWRGACRAPKGLCRGCGEGRAAAAERGGVGRGFVAGRRRGRLWEP